MKTIHATQVILARRRQVLLASHLHRPHFHGVGRIHQLSLLLAQTRKTLARLYLNFTPETRSPFGDSVRYNALSFTRHYSVRPSSIHSNTVLGFASCCSSASEAVAMQALLTTGCESITSSSCHSFRFLRFQATCVTFLNPRLPWPHHIC